MVFNAIECVDDVEEYNPLGIQLTNNPRIMFVELLHYKDLDEVINENYNENIDRIKLWAKIKKIDDMANKAAFISNQISTGQIILKEQKLLNYILFNNKRLQRLTKKLGKIVYSF